MFAKRQWQHSPGSSLVNLKLVALPAGISVIGTTGKRRVWLHLAVAARVNNVIVM
jgi:hypothetical protein